MTALPKAAAVEEAALVGAAEAPVVAVAAPVVGAPAVAEVAPVAAALAVEAVEAVVLVPAVLAQAQGAVPAQVPESASAAEATSALG